MSEWVKACSKGSLGPEEALRFDYRGKTYAIFCGPDGGFYATDGLCTHEAVHLADGLVIDFTVECPKHNGIFDIVSGEPKGPPVCKKLQTYPVKVSDDSVLVAIPD